MPEGPSCQARQGAMRVIFTVNPKVKRCQSRAGYERFGRTAAGCNWVDGKPERMRARTTNSGRTNGAGRAVALATAAAVALTMSACDPAQPKNGDAPAASQTPTATQPSTATELPTAPASPPTSQPPTATASPSQGGQPTGQQTAGKPGHVFVINLENKGYFKVWGKDSPAPYLSQTLRGQGVLLSEYYGIAHNSNPNYLAQISGQASNPMTRDDCPTYAPFAETGTAAPGQLQGTGCVYPA